MKRMLAAALVGAALVLGAAPATAAPAPAPPAAERIALPDALFDVLRLFLPRLFESPT